MPIYSLDSIFRQFPLLSQLISLTEAKKFHKTSLCIESKVEFSGELKFKTSKN